MMTKHCIFTLGKGLKPFVFVQKIKELYGYGIGVEFR